MLKTGGARYTKGILESEFLGKFIGVSLKNRGCTCTPGTPPSAGPESLKDSNRFQKNPKDFKRFQKIPKDSKRFQKIPKDSKIFQKVPKDPKDRF